MLHNRCSVPPGNDGSTSRGESILVFLDGFTDFWYQLLHKIKMLTGVVEVGLFCDMAKAAYFGNEVSCSILSIDESSCVFRTVRCK
jgi:ribose 5-phosphate isomerase